MNYKKIHCPWAVDNNDQFDYLWESDTAKHFGFPVNQLSKTFVDWANSKHIHISFAEIFYLPAHCSVRRIHTDLDRITHQCSKINFIIGGEDAYMQWFSLKSGAQSVFDINTAPTVINQKQVSPYLSWHRDDCELIEETVLSGANIIHAGIPHVVFTHTRPRIAISVVLQCQSTKQRLSVEDAIVRIEET